eukprot:c17453_g1_i1.p1 GENE.c17453_g1_i1~~c17453_g1_i1.p1  ORF type:complete len:156 (-),score=72.29 c17453_g1_i1:3-470(-)
MSVLGSSTVSLAMIRQKQNENNWEWHTANLGDSGFLILREGKLLKFADQQQHSLQIPFQFSLSEHPAVIIDDSPEDASFWNGNVIAGDVIVMGTDGIWDNIFIFDIVSLCQDLCEAVANEKIWSDIKQITELTDSLVNTLVEIVHEKSLSSSSHS